MKGFFITIEGGEGAGKTSILHPLKKDLENENYEVLITREPGGIEISEQIRNIILDPNNKSIDSRTEALLYAAARRQHLIEKINPALEEGKIVLCDRFIDSSLAYQGYARDLGIDEVLAINQFAIDNCMPSLTLLLKIEPKKGLQRIMNNNAREKNRLDLESIQFHERVYEGYQILASRYRQRIKVVDAEQDIENVKSVVFNHIITHIDQKKVERSNE